MLYPSALHKVQLASIPGTRVLWMGSQRSEHLVVFSVSIVSPSSAGNSPVPLPPHLETW